MAESSHTTDKELCEEFFILGITSKGRQFRPSDWAERLCGAMTCFTPGLGGIDAHLKFSPYVHPTVVDGTKAVVVSHQLQKIEPMAYHFVVSFAKDNDLQVVDACFLPEKKPGA